MYVGQIAKSRKAPVLQHEMIMKILSSFNQVYVKLEKVQRNNFAVNSISLYIFSGPFKLVLWGLLMPSFGIHFIIWQFCYVVLFLLLKWLHNAKRTGLPEGCGLD